MLYSPFGGTVVTVQGLACDQYDASIDRLRVLGLAHQERSGLLSGPWRGNAELLLPP